MTDLEITPYTTYEEFTEDWDGSESDTRMLWQLLGQLDAEKVLIEIPEWLAEEKVGYVDGATPTLFVGRIEEESEKAILLEDSAAANDLKKIAHRIHNLEQDKADPNRDEWLDDRLEKYREKFQSREEVTTLANKWIPKSQIRKIGQRA